MNWAIQAAQDITVVLIMDRVQALFGQEVVLVEVTRTCTNNAVLVCG